MQSGETLAAVYAVFEKAGGNMNVENSEGDSLHDRWARRHGGVQLFAAEPRTHARSVAGPLEQVATMPSWNSKKHAAAWRTQGKRITETKRKAGDAHVQIRAHRDRCRRVSAEFEAAEEDLNECLASNGAAQTRHCRGNTCVVMRHH